MSESDGQSEDRQQQDNDVKNGVAAYPEETGADVSIQIPGEKHALKEEQTCGPDRRAAAEEGEDELAEHRLDPEKQAGAEKQRHSDNPYSETHLVLPIAVGEARSWLRHAARLIRGGSQGIGVDPPDPFRPKVGGRVSVIDRVNVDFRSR